MTAIAMSSFLRRVLLFDAATCVVAGAVLLVAAPRLAPVTGIPAAILLPLGLVLLVFGAAVGWVGTRRALSRIAVLAILSLNALWAAESVLVLLLGWIGPSPMGRWLVIGQAVAVAVIAELQFVGLQRARRATA